MASILTQIRIGGDSYVFCYHTKSKNNGTVFSVSDFVY